MVALPKLDFLNFNDNKIPIPSPDFLRDSYSKLPKKVGSEEKPKELTKHEKAYDAFCHWSAIPQDERKPTTIRAFERKWKVPDGYSSAFRQREDFHERRTRYFWEWMMDKFPDVVQAIYKGAVKGNSAQAKTFAELVAKRIDTDKPKRVIQPFMVIGVPQEKVDKLFVAEGYEDIRDIVPES